MANATPEVVLLNPPAEVVREAVYDAPRFPAIGIGYVAGYLWRSAGIRPVVIDGKLGRLTPVQVVRRIARLRPRIVGIGSMTHMIVTTGKIAKAIKEALPDVTIVVGGFHASFLPERTLREFPQFDFVVVGEGEIAFSKLVQALLKGETYESIPGVGFRRADDQIRLNGRGEIPDHLDKLGMPEWSLFPREDLTRYATLLPIMSQRGCPFHCNFCSRPYGNEVRLRSVDHVVEEIERNIREFGLPEMTFYDETFTVNRRYVANLCDAIVARAPAGLPRWSSMVHANTVTPELLAKMKRAGCTYLGFGVESGHEDIIRSMKKGVTKERILKAAAMFRQAGIRFGGYFILGHPNETRESAKATIDLAARLNADVTCIGIMVPYPGTEVWELAIRGQGGYRVISDNWEDFNKQIGNALELETLSRRDLERLQLEGYLKVFLYNFRLWEALKVMYEQRGRLRYKLFQLLFPRWRKTSAGLLGDLYDPNGGRLLGRARTLMGSAKE
ncbi:MAG: B12-binding domain-containing radical SAM protein [Candidatus Methylomirabilales bacterium]